jgi:tRNA A-37 threonylcarbamoyl transferase component Bud32
MSDPNASEYPPTGEILDGRYRLVERIGEGGMARVYRAEDTALGRTVAIKVLRGAAGDMQVIERARSETTLLASLNHHALVTLFDARIDDDAVGYLVMEYVDGITLRDLIARGPVDPEELAGIAADVAEALHYAHEAGVVHRDVKPGNVLLTASPRPDRRWRAKLADFGIAHLLDSDRVTTPGLIVGTMAYLAPEQARGAAPAPPADIYAFGLMLLEALTATRPFGDVEGIAAVTARLAAAPVVPDTLAPAWQDLLSRMTAMIPADRPTALDVALASEQLRSSDAATGAVRDDTVTRAMPPGFAESGMPPLPAVPAAVAAGGLAAGGLGAAAVADGGVAPAPDAAPTAVGSDAPTAVLTGATPGSRTGAGAAAGGGAWAAGGALAGAGAAAGGAAAAEGGAAAGSSPARDGGSRGRRALIIGAVIAGAILLGAVLLAAWLGSLAATPTPASTSTPTPTATSTPTPTPTPTPEEPAPAPPADDDDDDDDDEGNENSGPGNNSGNNGDENGKDKGKKKDG